MREEQKSPKHLRLQQKYLFPFIEELRNSGRTDSIQMMEEVRAYFRKIQSDPKNFPIP